ncbi:MAG: hypothetical protein ACW99G_17605, partial [Candidatus Thorarchaeota archaeon]
MGGVGEVFKAGKGDATGIFGILGGVGGLATAFAPLIAPAIEGIKALFKLGGPDIARDVARDMGPQISQELADAIEQSGQPVQ